MEYTCFEGMGILPFLMEERGSAMHMHSASSCSSGSNQLLESFNAKHQQHLNPNYYYNPPIHFNFPSVSCSTTDPTLLLSDLQPQRQEELFSIGNSVNVSSNSKRDDDMGIDDSCCGLSSFPIALQEPHHSRSSSNSGHHNGGVVDNSNATTAERMNLNVDTTMMDAGGGNIPRGSSSRSIDPFSFCGGGGRGSGGNASSQSQWIPQMCSLPSDQYYSCGDALMMPKLVSDPFADSPQQQQKLQQRPMATYYTSSTSVYCLHEADSCGSSDRDRSTTSEEINWMNNNSSGNNNSDISTLPNLHRGCGDSVTGLMLSSPSVVPVKINPDEYSSSIAAAANDDGEVAAVTTATLDQVRFPHHHHTSTCGSSTIECGAVAPSGRISWMSPSIGSCHNPLLQLQQMSNGLVPMLPRSVLGPFKPYQQRSQTSDNHIHSVQSSVQKGVPFPSSTSSQQNYSSNNNGTIYPRYNNSAVQPIMPPLINPGVANNCTTSSNSSFCRDFHSFSNWLPQQQQGAMAATASSVQAGGMLGVKEFNLGGGIESRRNYGSDQGTRKPSATSIEPQSVAARFRRKKISERVKILEKLIPGVDKMDTASMLDEAIEYVKFLQLQAQLLDSMGESEAVNNGSTTAPATTSMTTTTTTTGNNNSSAFYNNNCNNPCKVDSSSLIGGGFGSSSHLSRSASFMQQVTIAAAATATTTKASSSPPLILSEVLQEQLFKQKLCLVSLHQFPQQQAR